MPLAQHTQNASYWLMPSLEGLAASYPPVIRFQVTFAIIERHRGNHPGVLPISESCARVHYKTRGATWEP